MEIVEKYDTRVFSALTLDSGIVLCDKDRGAFITLRSVEDLENLKDLLNSIDVNRVEK